MISTLSSWSDVTHRSVSFLRPDSESRRVVSACPDRTVSALVSHMMGINEDILAGRMGGFTSDAWTQAHVDRHLGESIPSLADAWERITRDFDVILPTVPAPRNSQLVMDAVTPEFDLRYAVGSTEARDSDAIDVALRWLLDRIERVGRPGPVAIGYEGVEIRTSALLDWSSVGRSDEHSRAFGGLDRYYPVRNPTEATDRNHRVDLSNTLEREETRK